MSLLGRQSRKNEEDKEDRVRPNFCRRRRSGEIGESLNQC